MCVKSVNSDMCYSFLLFTHFHLFLKQLISHSSCSLREPNQVFDIEAAASWFNVLVFLIRNFVSSPRNCHCCFKLKVFECVSFSTGFAEKEEEELIRSHDAEHEDDCPLPYRVVEQLIDLPLLHWPLVYLLQVFYQQLSVFQVAVCLSGPETC